MTDQANINGAKSAGGIEESARPPRILVIMATYNGARYLREQIDSILAQEKVDVRLQINDDCSIDGSYEIASEYASNDIRVSVKRNDQNLGVSLNFMQGFYDGSYEGYDYYAYSDQDDVWKKDKLIRACRALCKYNDRAALWFCDVMNVDENWDELGLEMSAYRKCEGYLGTPLICNYANGCAQVFNREMANLIALYPRRDHGRLHDAWAILIARTCGEVIADFDYVGQYRRIHGANVVGRSGDIVTEIKDLPKVLVGFMKHSRHNASKTAQDLHDGYEGLMDDSWRSVLISFLHYRDSLKNRIQVIKSDDYWLPTKQQRLVMRLKFLTGRY